MATPLPSPRHETFAQAVASGMSASKAYSVAYARPRNGATRSSAARLLTKANVRRRIAELRCEAAEQARASLRILIPALEECARIAISAGRLNNAVRLLQQLADISAQANRAAWPQNASRSSTPVISGSERAPASPAFVD
jgi:hypothetical protein